MPDVDTRRVSHAQHDRQRPAPNLGSIIAGGQPYLLTAWWICTLPALMLVLLGIGIGLIGDGLTGRDLEVSRR